MSNKRMDDLGAVVQRTLDREIKRITHDIEEDVMKHVAAEMEIVFRREMRMSGVLRSEKTGTHDLRSESEKEGYRKWGGTVLNTGNRVAASSGNNTVDAYAGVPSGRDYVARFLDQGTEKRMAWHHERETGTRQEPLNFREKAAKTIESMAEAMTKKGILSALTRVRPTIVKRNLRSNG
jgi:hypothetical protein